MSDTLKMILFVVGYLVVMRWVLPRFGVRTCLSGNCSANERRWGRSGEKRMTQPPEQSRPER